MSAVSQQKSDRELNVAVVGATGAVGEVLFGVLEERQFPVGRLLPLASSRSAGRSIRFRGEEIRVEEARPEAFEGVDLVFFAATGSLSKELAPEAVARGATVIDKSNTWRMEETVPPGGPGNQRRGPRRKPGHHRLPQLHHHRLCHGLGTDPPRGGPEACRSLRPCRLPREPAVKESTNSNHRSRRLAAAKSPWRGSLPHPSPTMSFRCVRTSLERTAIPPKRSNCSSKPERSWVRPTAEANWTSA